MASEYFYLRLTDFETKIKQTWRELQIENELCDVTLACDDRTIVAHKLVISCSSPVFRNILKQNLNPHPVIYLRGVKYKDLQSLVNFMYQGEVNVVEEDLKSFLDAAKDLKIKGLVKDSGRSLNPRENQQNATKPSEKNHCNYEITTNLNQDTKSENLPKIEDCTLNDNNVEISIPTDSTSKIIKPEKVEFNTESIISLSEDTPVYCEKCGKQFNNPVKLRRHQIAAHKEGRYQCDQCDYKATASGNLKKHKAWAHEGVRYPCDKCDILPFKYSNHLRQHKAREHEGITHQCDKCDTSPFKYPDHLRRHKEKEHEGIRYPCEQCKYIATAKYSLKRHSMAAHKI